MILCELVIETFVETSSSIAGPLPSVTSAIYPVHSSEIRRKYLAKVAAGNPPFVVYRTSITSSDAKERDGKCRRRNAGNVGNAMVAVCSEGGSAEGGFCAFNREEGERGNNESRGLVGGTK